MYGRVQYGRVQYRRVQCSTHTIYSKFCLIIIIQCMKDPQSQLTKLLLFNTDSSKREIYDYLYIANRTGTMGSSEA